MAVHIRTRHTLSHKVISSVIYVRQEKMCSRKETGKYKSAPLKLSEKLNTKYKCVKNDIIIQKCLPLSRIFFLSGAQDKFFLLQMKAVWIFFYTLRRIMLPYTLCITCTFVRYRLYVYMTMKNRV